MTTPLTATTLFKILNDDGSARMGTGQWHLPEGDQPGAWMPAIHGELIPCKRGYHLTTIAHLTEWLGPALFVAEYRGELLDAGDKLVVRQARLLYRVETWNDRTARLFACDCAERALAVAQVTDARSHAAIAVARRFANGDATRDELAAARGAARAAAWAAAGDAAGIAARAAARAAAWAAPWDAPWDAEREWQGARLLQYLNGEAVA